MCVEISFGKMGKIVKIEYFWVFLCWFFVKIIDEDGNVGWGEVLFEGYM